MSGYRPGWYPEPGRRGVIRFWDGHGWTHERAVRAERPRGLRPFKWALVALTVMAGGLGLYSCVQQLTNPYIARRRGVVASIERSDDRGMRICMDHTVDAGSTYGDRGPEDDVCFHGVVVGAEPEVGDCIVMERQAESSALRVEPSDDC